MIKDEATTASLLLFFVLVVYYVNQLYLNPFKKEPFHCLQKIELHFLLISISNTTISMLAIISSDSSCNTQSILFIIYLTITNALFFVSWFYLYFLSQRRKVKTLVKSLTTRMSQMKIAKFRKSSAGNSPEIMSPTSPNDGDEAQRGSVRGHDRFD